MKTDISASSQSLRRPWTFVLSAAAKNMLSLPARLAWTALIALALTVAVCDIKAQSAAPSGRTTTRPAGRVVPTSRVTWSAPSASTSQPTGASTPWAGAALTHPAAPSLTRSSTTRPPTLGSPRPLPTRITGRAAWLALCSPSAALRRSTAWAATQFFGDFSTPRVFSYNPVTDTITTLTAADYWPGETGLHCPGRVRRCREQALHHRRL